MSDFLFAMPGWLSGCARTLDLFALFEQYNVSLTPGQADWLAVQSDARAVYKDLWKAYDELSREVEDDRCQAEHPSVEHKELSLAR
jgi:hypothetical protein